MLAGRSRQKLHAGKPDSLDEVDLISERVREGIRQARTLVHGLLPVGCEPDDFINALKELARWAETTSGMICRFSTVGEPPEVADPDRANHLFRIAQEAVHNAIHHRGGTKIEIRLQRSGSGNLTLYIKDNGSGFDTVGATRGNGLGLHPMEYRARAIGPHLTIRQRKGGSSGVLCVKWE